MVKSFWIADYDIFSTFYSLVSPHTVGAVCTGIAVTVAAAMQVRKLRKPAVFCLALAPFELGLWFHPAAILSVLYPLRPALSKGAQVAGLFCIITRVLFQKHLLGQTAVARRAGRFFLWPTMPSWVIAQYFFYRNWYTEIDTGVFLGAVPVPFFLLGRFKRLLQGDLGCDGKSGMIAGVINFMDEYTGPTELYQKHNITQLYLPTIDHCEPTLSNLKDGVAFIERYKEEGKAVYLHCKSGKGRSAALAMCYLMKAKNLTPEEAQKYLSNIRNVRKKLFLQPNVRAYHNSIQK
eukprot:g2891.t1